VADRSVLVRLRADISDYQRKLSTAAATTSMFVKNLDSADSRMSNMVQTALALAPALVPLGSVAVPALAGVTAGLGAAAGAAGVTVLAFSGVGDAVKALNDYELERTPENLDKVREAMAKLGPEGRDMARMLQDLRPAIQELRALAQGNMFPGVTEGLEELVALEPQLNRFVANVSSTLGDLTAEAGDSLNNDEWVAFFDYINREAQPILIDMSRTLGNIVEGLSGLLMGLDPLADQFWSSMLEGSRDFNEWSKELEDDQGFQSFVDYVERVGPKAAATFGSLVDALAALVAAGAPVGEATLPVIRALAEALEAIAESPAGPVLIGAAAGLSAVSRAVALYRAANGSALAEFLGRTGKDGQKAGMGARGAAAGFGILALSLTDVDDNLGIANAAMGASIGLLAGPWGAAVGGAIGLLVDMASSSSDFKLSTEGLVESLDQQTGAITSNTTAWAANELEKNGVLRSAAQLGLDLGDVTQAALGNADAIDRVTSALSSQRAAFFDSNGYLQVSTDTLLDFDDAAGLVQGAIAATGGEVTSAQGKFSRLTEATGGTADGMDEAADATRSFEDALASLNRRLDRRASLRDYEAALDDFTKALKENGRAVDINTPKGRAMQAALDEIASSALRVAEGLDKADRKPFLTRARQDFVDAATKLYGSERAAEKLADKLFTLDRINAEPKVDVPTGPAMAGIRAIEAGLRRIPDEHVKIYLDRVGTMGGRDPMTGGADGMTVPGRRQPYGDKGLYMLAPGEEVISNRRGQADRHRALLKKINAGLADGGSAGGWAPNGWAQPSGPYMGINGLSPALNGFHELKDALRDFRRRLEEATKAVDREKRQRDELIDASNAFAAAVGGAYAKADPFSGGLSDFDIATAASTNDSNAAKAALAAAANKGLDGPLYQALAASGNLTLLQEFAGLTAAQIAQKEQQFATQSAAQAGLGGAAAQHEFAEAIKQQNKELKEAQKERQKYAALTKEVQRRLDQLPEKVERGARAGVGDRDRRTSQRVAAGR